MVSGVLQFTASKCSPMSPASYVKPHHSSIMPFGQGLWPQFKMQINVPVRGIKLVSHLHSTVNSSLDFVG